MSNDFHVKYRPEDFDQILGQEDCIHSLQFYEQTNNWPHVFLFSGMSGVGKSTLSRIISKKLKTRIVELDGAAFNNVDTMRSLIEDADMPSWLNVRTCYIIDECHMLTKNAFSVLLKTIEEPKEGIYFIFCTTDISKIPRNIKTRCVHYELKPLSLSHLRELLIAVCEIEEIKLNPDALYLIAQQSNGSAREALTNLIKVRHCDSLETVKTLLEMSDASATVIQLCQFIARNKNNPPDWPACMRLVSQLEEMRPEGLRLSIVNYMSKCALSAKNTREALYFVKVIDAFNEPWYNSTYYISDLIAALGRALLTND